MKTKEEILDSIIGNIRAENKQEIWYDDAIKAMEEYALQFKPKKKVFLKKKLKM